MANVFMCSLPIPAYIQTLISWSLWPSLPGSLYTIMITAINALKVPDYFPFPCSLGLVWYQNYQLNSFLFFKRKNSANALRLFVFISTEVHFGNYFSNFTKMIAPETFQGIFQHKINVKFWLFSRLYQQWIYITVGSGFIYNIILRIPDHEEDCLASKQTTPGYQLRALPVEGVLITQAAAVGKTLGNFAG